MIITIDGNIISFNNNIIEILIFVIYSNNNGDMIILNDEGDDYLMW